MPILDLQQRARELGRIRIGVQVPTSSGKTRPEKLDRFRITSASQALIERVAVLYGGEAKPWDNNGSPQFEVITTTNRLPILVPPKPISQYYELWSGGGCQRRCDGQTELLKDKPCLCGPDPAARKCKPTTRLNVILRDVEGIGVWRLESHGYYSAIELPDVAAFVARAGSYVSAWLSLEQRTALRDGKTLRWMVPTIEVDITPAALLAGPAAPGQIGPTPPPAIEVPTPALPAAPVKAQLTEDEVGMVKTQISDAVSLDQLREVWDRFAREFVMSGELHAVAKERAEKLRTQKPEQKPESLPADEGGVDALWMEALSAAPEEWSTADVERDFVEVLARDGITVEVGSATAENVQRYLDLAYPTTTAK